MSRITLIDPGDARGAVERHFGQIKSAFRTVPNVWLQSIHQCSKRSGEMEDLHRAMK